MKERVSQVAADTVRVLADCRWTGNHGIGRVASETISRLEGDSLIVKKLDGLSMLHPLEPIWLSWKIARYRPDVYFSPGFNPPLRSAVPFVFTVHDLVHLSFAQDYSWKQRVYYALVVKPAIKRAATVLTVSEFSKSEIARWSGVPESRLRVVSPGVGGEFSPEAEPIGLPFPYFLYVGNRKSHKNLPRLLAAFARSQIEPDVRLVLTGKVDREISELATSLGLEGQLKFFGEVSDRTLPGLYRGAEALIFPSLMEGFGLPPLEAMACGTPVIASSASSIPEVVGEAGILLSPYNIDGFADAMERVLHDRELRERMSRRGVERAELFSWNRTAGQVREVLQEASQKATRR